MKKFVSVAVVAAFAMFGAMQPQTASAGTVSYTASLGPALLDWTTMDMTQQFVTMPKFDPAMFGGALPSAMTLSFSGYMSPTLDPNAQYSVNGVNIQNNANSTIVGATLAGTWTFSLAHNDLAPNFEFGLSIGPVGPVNVAPHTFVSFAAVGDLFSMSGSQTYSPVPFVGAGDFTLTATNLVDLDINVPGSNAVVTWAMLAGGLVTVTYEVPAPTPLALLGLGLAVIAFVSRRKAAGQAT